MRDTNVCVFTGRLGKDPESRFAASGTAITSFSLAVSGWNGQEETTTWLNVKCFGKTAELASQYLTKGSRVCIQARFQINSWENQEGNKRQSPEFICNDIVFLDTKPKDGQSQQPSTQPSTRQQSQAGGQGGRHGGSAADSEDIPF